MNKPFKGIRITGLDLLRTARSPKSSRLRHIHLTLSDTPPREWIEFFNQERSVPRQLWRHAWIEGRYIVVDCVPEEIDRHLSDLKEEVESANKMIIALAAKREEALVRRR